MARMRFFISSALVALLSGCMLSVSGCSKNDPEGEHGNHRPVAGVDSSDPENGGTSGNGQENGEETPEEVSPIVGEWTESSTGAEKLVFNADGTFAAYSKISDGRWILYNEGTYRYNDTVRWLWLSFTVSDEVNGTVTRLVDYRCVINDSTLTLTSVDNKSRTFVKSEQAF